MVSYIERHGNSYVVRIKETHGTKPCVKSAGEMETYVYVLL